MAAADKARYFLERSVPELQELVKKDVFTDDEIKAIVRKKSDFEHILNGPGSKPSDYIKYATYEMNLDALKKKRCRRMGVKSTAYNGKRSVFFILERGTRKFPGDKTLWLQYIQYCQHEKANKKLATAFTAALRLRPRDGSLWILAAKHYAESQGDMPSARGYLQRGIRFCADEKTLYLQYAKLELVYLAKLAARKEILGLHTAAVSVGEVHEEDENTITLPVITAEEFAENNQGLEHIDTGVLERLASAPVLQGAVPIAIFDTAMKQFHNSPVLAEAFFDLTTDFSNVDAISKVQQHFLDYMKATIPNSIETTICEARYLLADVNPSPARFPTALGQSLAVIRRSTHHDQAQFAERVIHTYLPLLQQSDLDEAVQTVLVSTLKSYLRRVSNSQKLIANLQKQNREADARILSSFIGAEIG